MAGSVKYIKIEKNTENFFLQNFVDQDGQVTRIISRGPSTSYVGTAKNDEDNSCIWVV